MRYKQLAASLHIIKVISSACLRRMKPPLLYQRDELSGKWRARLLSLSMRSREILKYSIRHHAILLKRLCGQKCVEMLENAPWNDAHGSTSAERHEAELHWRLRADDYQRNLPRRKITDHPSNVKMTIGFLRNYEMVVSFSEHAVIFRLIDYAMMASNERLPLYHLAGRQNATSCRGGWRPVRFL